MLWNQDWDKKVETKVEFGLADFIAWLETQDPNKTYRWAGGCEGCLVEQYAVARGMTCNEFWNGAADENGDTLYDRISTNNGCIAALTPHTFGAALERARVALTSTDRTD